MVFSIVITLILVIFFAVTTVVPWCRAMMVPRELRPDRPLPFGFSTAWLAVQTEDTERVVETLALWNVRLVNWQTGISVVYDEALNGDYVFVTPPVDGWTLVIGLALPHPAGSRFADRSLPLLFSMGKEFRRIDFYYNYPVISLVAWARILNGKLTRAFAWGDDGVIWNKGAVTDDERQLNIKVFDQHGVSGSEMDQDDDEQGYPTEDDVLAIAAHWSVDPTSLDRIPTSPDIGYIGQVPEGWRVAREG